MSLKDYLGRELEVGRFIVYPGLIGRSATMNFGMIRGLRPDAGPGKVKVLVYTDSGRKAGLQYPGRIVQVDDSLVPDDEEKAHLLSLRPTVLLPMSEA